MSKKHNVALTFASVYDFHDALNSFGSRDRDRADSLESDLKETKEELENLRKVKGDLWERINNLENDVWSKESQNRDLGRQLEDLRRERDRLQALCAKHNILTELTRFQEVDQLLRENQKIQAIRLVREVASLGLKDAKDFVETLVALDPAKVEEMTARLTSSASPLMRDHVENALAYVGVHLAKNTNQWAPDPRTFPLLFIEVFAKLHGFSHILPILDVIKNPANETRNGENLPPPRVFSTQCDPS